jgi:hypothetical protein
LRYGDRVFRDDRQALALQNDDLRREVDQLRAENVALRQAIATHATGPVPLASRGLYRNEPLAVTEAERLLLGVHGLERFPVWLAALLHVLTFGVFSVVFYAIQGGRLPEVEAGDPCAQKGVGFFLIPYFNLYWLFAFPTRLADRLNLQLRLRGERPMVSQALMVACSLSTTLMLGPVLWIAAVVQIQQAINRIVELGPVVPRQVAWAHGAQGAAPEQFAQPGETRVRVDVAEQGFAPAEPGQPWSEDAAWLADPARRTARR